MSSLSYDGCNFQMTYEKFRSLDLWQSVNASHNARRDVDNWVYVKLAITQLRVQLWTLSKD